MSAVIRRDKNLRGKILRGGHQGLCLGSRGRLPPGSGPQLGLEGKTEEEAGPFRGKSKAGAEGQLNERQGKQRCSECGVCTRSIRITGWGEVSEVQCLGRTPEPTGSEPLGTGPAICVT